jgi:hypothetical protein
MQHDFSTGSRSSIALAAVLALGCESAEVKECLKQYEQAQAIVYKVDAGASESVAQSLKAVEGALALCKRAERHKEVAELTSAKNQLSAQLSAIERKAARRKKPKPKPDELTQLQKKGDPKCPKGQAYRHKDLNKEIRCVGPQVADMSFGQAKEYFSDRNYSIQNSDQPATLKA